MAFGFLSFLIANAATFSVATQAYSDLFVLLILGWCLGFLLAMPHLAGQKLAASRRPAKSPWDPQLAGAPLGAARR
jgi:hypothetical protein